MGVLARNSAKREARRRLWNIICPCCGRHEPYYYVGRHAACSTCHVIWRCTDLCQRRNDDDVTRITTEEEPTS